ncbi:MAG: TetR family transcriptional regulator [bacterium]|nr:TetR family transcriptional regulator [bacterium]
MSRRATPSAPALDGRVRRSERSREAIVGALFDLIGEGVLQPTARQVADRAGVGIRSVFRHFSEMESLYRAMDGRLEGEAVRILTAPAATGTLAQRVRALVRQRVALFERIAPYKRSANLLRWRSPFLQQRHQRMRRVLRDDLCTRLPELRRAPADRLEAVDLLTSFETWDDLRVDRRLGVPRAAAVVERAVLALAAPRTSR